MTKDTIVAKRYAKALFAVAQERSIIQQVEASLRTVVQAIDGNAELKKMLHHPAIAEETKLELLRNIFEGNIEEPVYNILRLLVERRREALLPALLQYYVGIADAALGQASAVVYSPFALTEAESREIAETFGRLTGKTIRTESVIDPSLLGGIQVRIGDRLYDGSLSGKLARLHKSLNETQAL
jgi:F-type H+-transporting ATPase subunit delta